MQAALKDKNDIKIFILYLMRNVGYPLEFENLNDIVIQDGVVGYFDFVECFGELLDTGNVREIKGENGDLYEITEQGKHVSDSLEGNLLGLIRDKSLKSALRLLSFKKTRLRYQVHLRAAGRWKIYADGVYNRAA